MSAAVSSYILAPGLACQYTHVHSNIRDNYTITIAYTKCDQLPNCHEIAAQSCLHVLHLMKETVKASSPNQIKRAIGKHPLNLSYTL